MKGHRHGAQANLRPYIADGRILSQYNVVPLKKIPSRVLKYDVSLREASLRAVQAMHTILTRMVLFHCTVCMERFPTFHPAYEPPPSIAAKMETLKRGSNGLAACSIEVHSWEEAPPFVETDLIAGTYRGVCLCCQRDMDKQLDDQGGDPGTAVIVPRRSADNHMDPCFRFPVDDLRELFEQATVVEAMLVALDHMQVNFVTIRVSGLQKFRRNVISFPQDVASFAARHGMMKQYILGDRVNSRRGPYGDLNDPNRGVREAIHGTDEDRRLYGVDGCVSLIFPGTVREVRPNGHLEIEYDIGGRAVEIPENVRPRQVMPWHPKNVPLHMMLRRNIGHGRVLEGLQVRWAYVARLLQALCAFPRQGYGPWRLGGSEEEPMHKYYDPALFKMCDVLTEESDLRARFAPRVADGVLIGAANVDVGADVNVDKVDVTTPEHFIAAGFDVTFVGPDADPGSFGVAGAGVDESGGATGSACKAEGGDEVVVKEDVFRRWLELSAMRRGVEFSRWWVNKELDEEGAIDAVKLADDESATDLFDRIRTEVISRRTPGRSEVS